MSKRLSVRELVDTLLIHRDRLGLPEEPMESLPVPLDHRGQPALGFFLFPWSGSPPASPTVYPPIARIVLGLDGSLVEAGATTPAQFGLATTADAPLGQHTLEPPLDMPAFEAHLAALHAALDRLLATGLFWTVPPAEATRADAAEFRAEFERLSHLPLRGCYRALNPRFFSWLDEAAPPAAGGPAPGPPAR